MLRKFSDAISSPQPLECSKTVFTRKFYQEFNLPLDRQTANNTSDASPIAGVTAKLLHTMPQLPNNVVFCLTEAPLYQPHLLRFFFINLGNNVFSYLSLRLDRQCMLLMGRILAFSFHHRAFLHLTSPLLEANSYTSSLLTSLHSFVSLFVLIFFHRKLCSEVVSALKSYSEKEDIYKLNCI